MLPVALTALAEFALVAGRARALAGRRTVAAVHALRKAQTLLAMLAHETLRTLADFVRVADAVVGARFVALGIGSCSCVWLCDSGKQWRVRRIMNRLSREM